MQYEKPEMKVMELCGTEVFTLTGDGSNDDVIDTQNLKSDWM